MNRRRGQTAGNRGPGLRRIGKVVAILVTLGGLAAGAGWLGAPERFAVETVRLASPPERVTAEAVRAAVLPHAGEGLLRVDVAEVQAELRALPWVQHASVRRVWPDRLEIELEEYRPVAVWGENALVDAAGVVFTPPHEEWPQGLPRLQGPEGSAGKLLGRFASARRHLAPLGLDVVELKVDARQAWSLTLDNGMELLLGTESQSLRLNRFIRVYGTLIGHRAESVERVDLRYTNGVALVWRETPDGEA